MFNNCPTKFNLFTVYVVMTTMCLYYLFSNNTILPDYTSYLDIYNNRDFEYLKSNFWEPIFILLIAICKYFNFSYEDFRNITFIISTLLLFISFTIIDAALDNSKVCSENNLFFYVIGIFSLAIFIFEYYFIRIRAGLCMSLFLFGCANFYGTLLYKKNIIFLMLGIVFIVMSSLVHFTTFIVMLIMIGLPTVMVACVLRFRFFTQTLVFCILLICNFIFLYYIVQSVVGRGFYSPLNSFRFAMIGIMPFAFFYLLIFKDNYLINKESHTHNDLFQYLMTLNYVAMALVLIIFYALNIVSLAGEALVRVFTISSGIALLVFVRTRQNVMIFWMFIIFVNEAFFLNTIYGQ